MPFVRNISSDPGSSSMTIYNAKVICFRCVEVQKCSSNRAYYMFSIMFLLWDICSWLEFYFECSFMNVGWSWLGFSITRGQIIILVGVVVDASFFQ